MLGVKAVDVCEHVNLRFRQNLTNKIDFEIVCFCNNCGRIIDVICIKNTEKTLERLFREYAEELQNQESKK